MRKMQRKLKLTCKLLSHVEKANGTSGVPVPEFASWAVRFRQADIDPPAWIAGSSSTKRPLRGTRRCIPRCIFTMQFDVSAELLRFALDDDGATILGDAPV